MFFRKSKPVVCAICGKPIEPKEGRFADRSRVTKVERHVHLGCHKPASGRVETFGKAT